jgi:hypothetical protein
MTKHASILGTKVYWSHVVKVLWWVNQIAPCGRERKGIKKKKKLLRSIMGGPLDNIIEA